MTNQMTIAIIIMAFILITGATPAYKNYRYWLQRKLGMWNILVPLIIALVMNLLAYLISGKIMLVFLLPLDLAFIVDSIVTWLQIKKINN